MTVGRWRMVSGQDCSGMQQRTLGQEI